MKRLPGAAARLSPSVLVLAFVLLPAACESEDDGGGVGFDGGQPTGFSVPDAAAPGADAASDTGGPVQVEALCAVGNGGCSADATCTELSGQAVCACKPGFVGDGKSCANVAVSLSGLRWELPCVAAVADPALCTVASTNVSRAAELAGVSGTTYAVKIRLRGVVEPKTYNGGTRNGFFQVGGTPASDTANIYRLTTSSPSATYFVNAGTTRAANALYCATMDYEATIDVAAGATVTLTAEPLDALQIKNRDEAGAAFVIPSIPPAPAAFNGQFVQMDVVSVVPK